MTLFGEIGGLITIFEVVSYFILYAVLYKHHELLVVNEYLESMILHNLITFKNHAKSKMFLDELSSRWMPIET